MNADTRQLLGRCLRELLGFAPVIAVYLSLTLWPARFSHLEAMWLLMQFLFIELPAATLAIILGTALARGTAVPVRNSTTPPRPVSARERDAAVMLAGVFLVVLMPTAIGYYLRDAFRGLVVASAVAPRVWDAWRFRADPRRALALAYSGWLALGFCFVAVGLVLVFFGGVGSTGGESAEFGGGFAVAYYVVLALGTAWLYHRVDA